MLGGVGQGQGGEGESLSMAGGGFFPSRLTATLSALKIVGGCLLIGLGIIYKLMLIRIGYEEVHSC